MLTMIVRNHSRSSVPTTMPPRGLDWHGADEMTQHPIWMWDLVTIWKPGCYGCVTMAPVVQTTIDGSLLWRPAGRLLSPAEVVKRLSRGSHSA